MNNQDKMREEFEGWFWCKFHEGTDVEVYWDLVFSIGSDGRYNGVACNAAWLAWQGFYETHVVDVPEGINGEYYADGYNSAIDAIYTVLEEAGVKYK